MKIWQFRKFIFTDTNNYEKHALRVSPVIAAVAKVSCKHGLWLVTRVNKNTLSRTADTARLIFYYGFIMLLLQRYVIIKYPPYITTRNTNVIPTDASIELIPIN